jgi:integrase
LVRESSGTTDYKAALKKLAERREAVSKGKEIIRPKIRKVLFKETMEEYLKGVKSQRSHSNKVYMGEQMIEKFGNIPLRRFNVSMLEGYQQELLSEGKSPATVNRRFALIKHMFRKAEDWGWIDEETLRVVRKVRKQKEPPGRLRYLTAEEVKRLLQECKNPNLRALATIAVNTGMRRGEILDLKWDHVDLRNGFLLVERSKNGESRQVPINGAVREALSRIMRCLNSPFVFCDEKGRKFKGARNAFERACLRAGIYSFRFHDLRHTAASFMAMAGVDLMSIKQVLGHKTIQMTLRYSHLSPGHLRTAVAAIDRAMAAPAESTSHFTSQSPESGHPALSSEVVTTRK